MDADTHAKGTPNIDYKVLQRKHLFLKNEEGGLPLFFQKNKSKYPMYYTSPTLREYVIYEGQIYITLNMNRGLSELLKKAIMENSIGYLGNNEGWVELKIT